MKSEAKMTADKSIETIDEGALNVDTAGGNSDGDTTRTGMVIPGNLVEKYKRMIKAGVPLDRIQQLASVEAGISPGQVASLLKEDGSSGDHHIDTRDVENEMSPSNSNSHMNMYMNMYKGMAKFVRMQKSGVPLSAIENAARLQGHDINVLHDALGIEEHDINEIRSRDGDSSNSDGHSFRSTSQSTRSKDRGMYTGTGTDISITFEPLDDGQVAFPPSSGHKFPLTDLVRKMVMTVSKTSRFGGIGSGPGFYKMVVDGLTLYNALGALKGVQFAQSEFNSTISSATGACMGHEKMSTQLAHSKRHGFVEMARSIGMAIPDTDTTEEPVCIEGLDELIHHIETVNKDKLERGRLLLMDGFYDFDSLHNLYPVGSFVLAKHAGGGGIDIFTQVLWTRYTQGQTIMGKPMKYFQLSVRYIVPLGDGKATFAEAVEGIEMFEGRRSVAASAVGSGVGLAFVPPLEREREELIKRYSLRGSIYNRITLENQDTLGKTHSYMEYEKGCFFMKRGGSSTAASNASAALATGGRIIVDLNGAAEFGHSLSIGRDDLMTGCQLKRKEYKLHLRLTEQDKDSHDGANDVKRSKHSKEVPESSMILFDEVPTEYLSLMWPSLVGFSLTAKSWGDILIDGLKDITFETDIFDRLVIPESRKRMIKALVKHTNKEDGFQDLVKGKGEGTVFLLYGEPGVGKTLTAEVIAEFLHRPLYSISMGALGTSADELERRLSQILLLSVKWDALVLLDEADIFLEARSSTSSLERNAMVSVMLRLVEYHQGILFFTSNRISSLDAAFQTRITLALRYETLSYDSRAQVWENLLLKSGYGSSLEDSSIDINALAKPMLNGREIKNSLRLAMALASDEGGVLSQDILIEAAAVVNNYKEAMKADYNDNDAINDKPCGWFWSSLSSFLTKEKAKMNVL